MGKLAELYVEITGRSDKLDAALKGTKGKLTDFKGGLNEVVGGLTGLNLAAIGVAGGIVLLGKEVKKAITFTADYGITVGDLAQNLMISTQEASKLIQVSDDYRVSVGGLQQAMKLALQNGFEPTIENIAKLSDQYNALQSPLERATLMSKTFGRNWQELTPLIAAGGDAIRKASGEIESSLILTEQAVQQAKDYKKALDNWDDSVNALQVSIGQRLLPAVTDLINVMTGAKLSTKDQATEIDKMKASLAAAEPYMKSTWQEWISLAEAEQNAASGLEDYNRELMRAGVALTKTAVATDKVTTQTAWERHEIDLIRKSFTSYGTVAADATEETDKFGNSLEVAATRARNVTGAVKALIPPLKKGAEEAASIRAIYNGLFKGVNLGLADNIATELDKARWLLAGGGTLQAAFENIQAALESGAITQEQADEYYKQLYIGATDLGLELGNIDLTTAAKNLSDNLGIPINAAWKLALQLNSTLFNLPTYTKLYIDIITRHYDTYPTGKPSSDTPHPPPGKPPAEPRQSGGAASRGYPYIVGERGPELFIPTSGGNIRPNSQLGSGGVNINAMTINAGNGNPYQVKEAVKLGILEAARALGRA